MDFSRNNFEIQKELSTVKKKEEDYTENEAVVC